MMQDEAADNTKRQKGEALRVSLKIGKENETSRLITQLGECRRVGVELWADTEICTALKKTLQTKASYIPLHQVDKVNDFLLGRETGKIVELELGENNDVRAANDFLAFHDAVEPFLIQKTVRDVLVQHYKKNELIFSVNQLNSWLWKLNRLSVEELKLILALPTLSGKTLRDSLLSDCNVLNIFNVSPYRFARVVSAFSQTGLVLGFAEVTCDSPRNGIALATAQPCKVSSNLVRKPT